MEEPAPEELSVSKSDVGRALEAAERGMQFWEKRMKWSDEFLAEMQKTSPRTQK